MIEYNYQILMEINGNCAETITISNFENLVQKHDLVEYSTESLMPEEEQPLMEVHTEVETENGAQAEVKGTAGNTEKMPLQMVII